jgi:hypothetical protein
VPEDHLSTCLEASSWVVHDYYQMRKHKKKKSCLAAHKNRKQVIINIKIKKQSKDKNKTNIA